jgi:membrane protease YdiL (CAAX protease family)
MNNLLEPLILYILLFCSGLITESPVNITFSMTHDLFWLFTYSLPALALILHLLLKPSSTRPYCLAALKKKPSPTRLGLSLAGLLVIGFGISALSRFIPSPIPEIQAPSGFLSSLVLMVSCGSTGYLEEAYFRLYLFLKCDEAGIESKKTMLLSCSSFALCHLYEGPLGVLNAALAGFMLGLVFQREKSLHTVALAHAAYNMLVFYLI